jgi:hypothetical protein
MCGEYGVYGVEERCMYGVGGGNLRERDRLESLDVDGVDNIRMHIEEIGCEIVYWNDLAQERARWLSVGHAVMNFRVP